MKVNVYRIFLVLTIILVNAGCDQLTKKIARQQLEAKPGQSYLSDSFRLTFVENEGAFLSLGAGLSGRIRYWALTVLPVFLLSGILIYTMVSPAIQFWQIIALSFILGGGISNIYDRIVFGQVVDFMNLGIGQLRTGIFNFADVSIMIGLFLMIPFLFWKKKPVEYETPSKQQEKANE